MLPLHLYRHQESCKPVCSPRVLLCRLQHRPSQPPARIQLPRPPPPPSRSSRCRLTDMSYMLNPGARTEANIEVHKYYSGTVLAVCFLALVLQAFLHKFGPWAELVDLPLLVTVYFGVSRRSPVSGLLLGAAVGIVQDGLSHDNPIGLFGIAKTLVGYLASSVGARIDTEHPASRLALIFLFFHLHQVVLAATEHLL